MILYILGLQFLLWMYQFYGGGIFHNFLFQFFVHTMVAFSLLNLIKQLEIAEELTFLEKLCFKSNAAL